MLIPHHNHIPFELTGVNSPRGPRKSLIIEASADKITGHIITMGPRIELVFSCMGDEGENLTLSPITNACSPEGILRSKVDIAYFLSKHIQRGIVEKVPGVFQPEWAILQDMPQELSQANRISPGLVIASWPAVDKLPTKKIAEHIKNSQPIWFSGFPVDIELSKLLTRDEKLGRNVKEIETSLKRKLTELHEANVSMLMIAIPKVCPDSENISSENALDLFNTNENAKTPSSFFIKPSWWSSQEEYVIRVTIDASSISVETKCTHAIRELEDISREFQKFPHSVSYYTQEDIKSEMQITWSDLDQEKKGDLLCELVKCIPRRIIETEIPSIRCKGGKFEARFILQDVEFSTRREDIPCKYELSTSYGKILSSSVRGNNAQGVTGIKTKDALNICFQENFPHLSQEEINQKVKELFKNTTSVAYQIAQRLSLWNKHVRNSLGIHSYWMNGSGAHGLPDIALDFSFMIDPENPETLKPCFLNACIDYENYELDLIDDETSFDIAMKSESIRKDVEFKDTAAWDWFRRRMLHPHKINI